MIYQWILRKLLHLHSIMKYQATVCALEIRACIPTSAGTELTALALHGIRGVCGINAVIILTIGF